jgi:hypothetical protein
VIREIEHRGVKLTLISKAGFGRIIGRSRITVETWIKTGFLLQPAFEDVSTVKNPFGQGEMTVRLFLKHEAFFARQVIQKYDLGRGVEISAECRKEMHEGMRRIRKQVLEGHPDLMTYPLILEFLNFEDCKAYFSGLGAPPGFVEQVYRKGDRLRKLEKIIRRPNGSQEAQKSP